MFPKVTHSYTLSPFRRGHTENGLKSCSWSSNPVPSSHLTTPPKLLPLFPSQYTLISLPFRSPGRADISSKDRRHRMQWRPPGRPGIPLENPTVHSSLVLSYCADIPAHQAHDFLAQLRDLERWARTRRAEEEAAVPRAEMRAQAANCWAQACACAVHASSAA